jgi:LacI family transcriptional regulator
MPQSHAHCATIPRIAPHTVKRVKEVDARLGYTPDPMMRALAVYRTGLRQTGFKETLAFIWP